MLKNPLLCLLLILPTGLVFAETATRDEAKVVAENWLTVMVDQKGPWSGSDTPSVSDVRSIVTNGLTVGYVADVQPQGFIVVPVLKEMPPVKAYSDASTFNILAEDGPFALLKEVLALRALEFERRYGSLQVAQPVETNPMFIPGKKESWVRLLQSPVDFKAELDLVGEEKIDSIGPLLTSSWDQNVPYNDVCPVGDGGRTLVGCVSTAASQVLQFHQWPPEGVGTYSYYWDGDDSCEGSSAGQTLSADLDDPYDWDHILDHASSSDPQEYRDAVSELCYEVGVCFRMDYGVCASGAVTSRILNVFPTRFRYSSDIDPEYRYHHTPESWSNTVKDEINEGRPMVYRIVGHAFVCDGWRSIFSEDQYHMNYGWDDNHTLWYTIDNLYNSDDLGSETLYRYIIPLRSSWQQDAEGVLADNGQALATCWFDCDGDLDDDQLLINESGPVLLRNDGGGVFSDASDLLPENLTQVRAASAADVDNDGDQDLYLVRAGQSNVLLSNEGSGFSDVTTGLLADSGLGTSAAWFDFDGDGLLDLALGNLDGSNRLLHQSDPMQFEDITPAAMAAQAQTRAISACDFDLDGDMDLYLTAENQANILLRNDGAGVFSEASTAPLNDAGAGVGAAWGDFDNDGDPDLYLVQATGSNLMLRNEGGGVFTDQTTSLTGNTGTGANATFFDQNHDGLLDLYLCNTGGENILLRNDGDGGFSSVDSDQVAGDPATVCSSVHDADGDGDLDIYLLQSGVNQMLNNDLRVHGWLTVSLSGTVSNADARGSKIRLVAGELNQTQWFGSNTDSRNQGTGPVHFGLGWYSQIDSLEVTWPDGSRDLFTGLSANQTYEISQSPYVSMTSGPLADGEMARGISSIDFDSDGDLDLYVVNHGSANSLLRNDGDGDFTLLDSPLNHTGSGNAAAWADYDGDGDLDVYLTNEGQDNVLFNNQGEGVFAPAPVFGLLPDLTSFGASWIDFNEDGKLDLYVVNDGEANHLYKAYGAVGEQWMFLNENSAVGDWGQGSMGVWADYNGDGSQDLFLSRNDDTDKFFANSGALGFDDRTGFDAPLYYGTSKGAAWADFDNDGDLDLYVANEGEPDRLYKNDNGYLSALEGGALGDNGNGQNVAWGDFDNDADLDLYVTRFNQPDLLLRNDGAQGFQHALTNLGDTGSLTRGMVWSDFDDDGYLDIYLATEGANEMKSYAGRKDNHWLHLDLKATGLNTGAVGSKVRTVTGDLSQMRIISAGSGYLSMQSPRVEFGLGQATVVDSLVVYWPDGEVQAMTNVAADACLNIIQGYVPSEVPDNDLLPTVCALQPAYPNPFNPSTRVQFDLPRQGRVQVSVYALDGSRVSTLVDEIRSAGRHVLTWNGSDERGQTVASGTYFFRMKAEGFTATRRAVLIK